MGEDELVKVWLSKLYAILYHSVVLKAKLILRQQKYTTAVPL